MSTVSMKSAEAAPVTRLVRSGSDRFWLLLLFGFLAFFYPGLFLAREAALRGDHWEQHYPWAAYLWQTLRSGRPALWTGLIQCGFPIAAEGQIGIFYLPNLLLSLFLPLRWAYAWRSLLHFAISGIATYSYARSVRLGRFGSFIAAFIFLFGTAYGGAFYNITSLETICWLPLGLLGLESFLRRTGKRYLLLVSASFALALLAGYLQIALFTIFIFGLYAILRIWIFSDRSASPVLRLRQTFGLGLGLLGAFILAYPQLAMSFELALLSNRVNLREEYAYVGSLSPLALMTLVFPKMQGIVRGNCLYNGLSSLLLVFAAAGWVSKRHRSVKRLWIFMAVLSLLLALGEWSPLYVGLVKWTRFYSFRVPAKFLVYLLFFLALLAGLGAEAFERARQASRVRDFKKTSASFMALLGIALAGYAAAGYAATGAGRGSCVAAGRWLVERFIYGRMGHPHSLEIYHGRLEEVLNEAARIVSFSNPWSRWALVMILLHFAFVSGLRHLLSRRIFFRAGLIALLAVDLYVFSWSDIRLDFDRYANLEKPGPVVQAILREKRSGRMGRLYGLRDPDQTLSLVPSVNMLYGIDDIGAYSPFVLGRYHESLGVFGNINDSNQAFKPHLADVFARFTLLQSLDVSHILTRSLLNHPALELVAEAPSGGERLYRLTRPHSRAHFVAQTEVYENWEELKARLLSPGFDPRKILLLERSERDKFDGTLPAAEAGPPEAGFIAGGRSPEAENWRVRAGGPGFFVLMNTDYPGWRVWVDGKPQRIFKAYGLFQAVWISEAGWHRIDFRYSFRDSLFAPLERLRARLANSR